MLNVKRSLTIKIVSVAILMIATSGITFVLMNKSSGVLVEHIETDIASERYMVKLFQEGLGLRLAILAKVANPSAEQPNISYNRAKQEIIDVLPKLQGKVSSDVDRILVDLNTWMVEADRMFERANAGDAAGAMRITRETEAAAWQAFRQPWLQALDAQAQLAQTAFQEAAKVRDSAITGSALMILVAMSLLVFVAWKFYRQLTHALGGELKLAVDLANQISNGDLTKHIQLQGVESSSLLASLARMQGSLKDLVKSVTENASHVTEITREVFEHTNASTQRIDQQSQKTDTVAAAVTEMSASSHEVAQRVSQTHAAAELGRDNATRSQQRMANTVVTLNNLGQHMSTASNVVSDLNVRCEGINRIINEIKGIAEQTNLLALNASIEAARAGDQGRGFAVVADEVRSLASRSADSSEEISSVVNQLVHHSEKANLAMGESRQEMEQLIKHANETVVEIDALLEAINQIFDMSTQIASASEEQSLTSEEINQNMQMIADMTEETRHALQTTHHVSQQLKHNAEALQQQISKFRV
ncbi:methyl-accepting chemotaxis protein [Nitrincola schmidtii]|uniref:methyl-accepting chemotaxis protein n=1 Tax=Nitrincola schmidtii TaxID=1730894 RepID=UPI00124D55A4|nr:methyl-accepting chemotaxis protein [Nitrincola schmidtii]